MAAARPFLLVKLRLAKSSPGVKINPYLPVTYEMSFAIT